MAMNPTIQAWLDAKAARIKAEFKEADAEVAALALDWPEKMRPATREDIQEGAVIWLPDYPDGYECEPDFANFELHVIERLEYSNDPDERLWKDIDGYRGGLAGSWVEVE